MVIARADDRDIRAGGACKPNACGVFDRNSLAKPKANIPAWIRHDAALDAGMEAHGGACVPLKHDSWERVVATATARFHFIKPAIALLIWKKSNLKGTVPLWSPARIVVNRFSRSREEACCEIFVRQNQLRIGFAALQCDTNTHLAHGAARE